MLLRVAATLLDIEGDDVLLAEARRTAQRILVALPDEQLRRCFLASELVRTLGPMEPLESPGSADTEKMGARSGS